MKKFKKLLKKAGRSYVRGLNEMYGPCIRYGINPYN